MQPIMEGESGGRGGRSSSDSTPSVGGAIKSLFGF
jgi:hypothetical protein